MENEERGYEQSDSRDVDYEAEQAALRERAEYVLGTRVASWRRRVLIAALLVAYVPLSLGMGAVTFIAALRDGEALFQFKILAVAGATFALCLAFTQYILDPIVHGLAQKRAAKALEDLARARQWKLTPSHFGYSGSVSEVQEGYAFEISPASTHAVTVSSHQGAENPWVLWSEPKAATPSAREYRRFELEDDVLKPIFPGCRVTHSAFADPEAAVRCLRPIREFVEKWGTSLLRMRVDQDGLSCHLRPGGELEHGAYLEKAQLEPLLDDMLAATREFDQQLVRYAG